MDLPCVTPGSASQERIGKQFCVFTDFFFGKQFGLRKILNEEHYNQKINGNRYLFQNNVCLKLYLPMHEHNNGQNSDINKDLLSF